MNINNLSSKYKVKRILNEDVDEVYNVCFNNPFYYEHLKTPLTRQSIIDDLKALPPNKTYDDKYFVGFYNENELVAVLDLILGYPKDNIAFIGFFMMNKDYQKKNIGTFIINEILDYLKKLGFNEVRLGYVSSNNQSKNFWYKNDFKESGFQDKRELYTVNVLQKEL
ncbi:MAG: GNAT family N-acetyltransferase [Bacilli bacterium]|nr:GNAT family N-acetyltransferase [Bacilli bacterium]